jgi:hypothetical protein
MPARPSLPQLPPALASTSIISARPADGQKLKVKCASRQSLIETVTNKFQQSTGGVSGVTGVGAYMGNGKGSDTKKKSRGSMTGKQLFKILYCENLFCKSKIESNSNIFLIVEIVELN